MMKEVKEVKEVEEVEEVEEVKEVKDGRKTAPVQSITLDYDWEGFVSRRLPALSGHRLVNVVR